MMPSLSVDGRVLLERRGRASEPTPRASDTLRGVEGAARINAIGASKDRSDRSGARAIRDQASEVGGDRAKGESRRLHVEAEELAALIEKAALANE